MKVYVTGRQLPLLWVGDPPSRATLTCEDYCKWYGLHVLHPDGRVEEVGWPDETLDAVRGETTVGDHVVNPVCVARMARRLGVYVHAEAMEMIIGRWEREKLETYPGTYE